MASLFFEGNCNSVPKHRSILQQSAVLERNDTKPAGLFSLCEADRKAKGKESSTTSKWQMENPNGSSPLTLLNNRKREPGFKTTEIPTQQRFSGEMWHLRKARG